MGYGARSVIVAMRDAEFMLSRWSDDGVKG